MNNCIEYSKILLCCLLNCALEYTMDHRGDIGIWVREAAINSLEVCIIFYYKKIYYFINIHKFTLGNSTRFD